VQFIVFLHRDIFPCLNVTSFGSRKYETSVQNTNRTFCDGMSGLKFILALTLLGTQQNDNVINQFQHGGLVGVAQQEGSKFKSRSFFVKSVCSPPMHE